MTPRMATSFLTGRLMVNYVKFISKIISNDNEFRCVMIVSGHSTIEVIKYPMAVLGGKSRPKLKNLKPFIKVALSQISPVFF